MNNEKFTKLLGDAREIVEKALVEGRPMTEEERNKSMNMVDEAKQGLDDAALERKIAELQAAAAKGEDETTQPEQKGSFGEQFANSNEFKSWMKQVAPNGHIPESAKGFSSPAFQVNMPFEKKAVITGLSDTSAGAFVQNDNTGIYVPMGRKPLKLRDRSVFAAPTATWWNLCSKPPKLPRLLELLKRPLPLHRLSMRLHMQLS